MKITVKITKEILERTKSCQFRIDSCAVSEAVREIFPNAYTLLITMYPFPISQCEFGYETIDLPPEAAHFIYQFDRCGSDEERASMKPISFDIEVPDSVIERIGIKEVETILSKSETLSKV